MGGDVSAVDLDQLDPGAQYEVQVKALVQNREGTPVSVRVTTREFLYSAATAIILLTNFINDRNHKIFCNNSNFKYAFFVSLSTQLVITPHPPHYQPQHYG